MSTNTKQVITWFEIPTAQLDRAAAFYSKVLRQDLKHELFGGVPHAMFVTADPATSGAVVHDNTHRAGSTGVRIYFAAPDSVEATLARAVELGGKVVLPATPIGDPGIIGVLEDLDGNHVGVHTRK